MGTQRHWALILGASSGFGEATAVELARGGMHILGVHLDRKATMDHVEQVVNQIKSQGAEALFFNVNAADADKRKEVLDQVEDRFRGHSDTIRVVVHSLAFGTLKPYITRDPRDSVNKAQIEMTLDVMANSLVYWTQDVVGRELMKEGGRIFAMTSSGGTRVLPTYGAVSAAKAALESHIRQLSCELAPLGITANSIRAGVTDTPALRKIPGNDKLISQAKERNPHSRLTTPADVARAIAALCDERTHWITGNVIGVDGGEDIVG